MRTLIRATLRLYPRSWRKRYGAEFATLLDDAPLRLRDAGDILLGAAREHARGFLHRPAWQIVFALAAVGALAGGGATGAMPRMFEARATVRLGSPGTTGDVWDVVRPIFRDGNLLRIATSRGVYSDSRITDAATLERMRQDIRIWPGEPRRGVVAIGFVGFDRAQSENVVGDLIGSLSDVARVQSIPVAVIDAPASTTISPKLPNLMAIGFVAGLLLGCVVSAGARLRYGAPPLTRTV